MTRKPTSRVKRSRTVPVKSVQRREFGRFGPVASPLLASTSMVELLLLAAAVIAIVVFADDDDLPGPRRCFAHVADIR